MQEEGGKILGGSGWEQMFHKAGLFSSGVPVSLLGGKHVKRTRSAHLLTLVWLEVMKHIGYDQFVKALDLMKQSRHGKIGCFLNVQPSVSGVKQLRIFSRNYVFSSDVNALVIGMVH